MISLRKQCLLLRFHCGEVLNVCGRTTTVTINIGARRKGPAVLESEVKFLFPCSRAQVAGHVPRTSSPTGPRVRQRVRKLILLAGTWPHKAWPPWLGSKDSNLCSTPDLCFSENGQGLKSLHPLFFFFFFNIYIIADFKRWAKVILLLFCVCVTF